MAPRPSRGGRRPPHFHQRITNVCATCKQPWEEPDPTCRCPDQTQEILNDDSDLLCESCGGPPRPSGRSQQPRSGAQTAFGLTTSERDDSIATTQDGAKPSSRRLRERTSTPGDGTAQSSQGHRGHAYGDPATTMFEPPAGSLPSIREILGSGGGAAGSRDALKASHRSSKQPARRGRGELGSSESSSSYESPAPPPFSTGPVFAGGDSPLSESTLQRLGPYDRPREPGPAFAGTGSESDLSDSVIKRIDERQAAEHRRVNPPRAAKRSAERARERRQSAKWKHKPNLELPPISQTVPKSQLTATFGGVELGQSAGFGLLQVRGQQYWTPQMQHTYGAQPAQPPPHGAQPYPPSAPAPRFPGTQFPGNQAPAAAQRIPEIWPEGWYTPRPDQIWPWVGPMSQTTKPPNGKWSDEEMSKLVRLKMEGTPFKDVTSTLEGRTEKGCSFKFNSLCEQGRVAFAGPQTEGASTFDEKLCNKNDDDVAGGRGVAPQQLIPAAR